VGIYTGNDVFVHCPSSGGRVREDRLTDTYWRKRYRGACRVHR
jgi:cell wall-associated NlpC family hydrolase